MTLPRVHPHYGVLQRMFQDDLEIILVCIVGLAVDKIGRKLTMLINCAIFMIGALILAFASSTTFLVSITPDDPWWVTMYS